MLSQAIKSIDIPKISSILYKKDLTPAELRSEDLVDKVPGITKAQKTTIHQLFDDRLRRSDTIRYSGTFNSCKPKPDTSECSIVTKPGTVLGSGSYGVVKKTTDSQGNPVAVKKIKLESGLLDANIGLLFNHPYIMKVQDVLTAYKCSILNSRPDLESIAMDLHIPMDNVPSGKKKASNISQLYQAIDFLYRFDILYTDIKQENLLVDAKGNFLLGDLGGCVYLNRKTYRLDKFVVITPGYQNPPTVECFRKSPIYIGINIPAFILVLVYAEIVTGYRVWDFMPDVSTGDGPEASVIGQMSLLEMALSGKGVSPAMRPLVKSLHAKLREYAQADNYTPAAFTSQKYKYFNDMTLPNFGPKVSKDMKGPFGTYQLTGECSSDVLSLPKLKWPSNDIVFVMAALHNIRVMQSRGTSGQGMSGTLDIQDIYAMFNLLLDALRIDDASDVSSISDGAIREAKVLTLLDGMIRGINVSDFFDDIPGPSNTDGKDLDEMCLWFFDKKYFDTLKYLAGKYEPLGKYRVIRSKTVNELPKFYSVFRRYMS
jgi:serine/threonine protein kinase